MPLLTNITLVLVELDSDPLSKILGSNLVDEKKNVVGRGDPTKNNQPDSLAEISHRQSLFRTNIMITKKKMLLLT